MTLNHDLVVFANTKDAAKSTDRIVVVGGTSIVT